MLVLEEAGAAAQKEAGKLRASLQEAEQAQLDTCRELQELRSQVTKLSGASHMPPSLFPHLGPLPPRASRCLVPLEPPAEGPCSDSQGSWVGLPYGAQMTNLKPNGLKQPSEAHEP